MSNIESCLLSDTNTILGFKINLHLKLIKLNEGLSEFRQFEIFD